MKERRRDWICALNFSRRSKLIAPTVVVYIFSCPDIAIHREIYFLMESRLDPSYWIVSGHDNVIHYGIGWTFRLFKALVLFKVNLSVELFRIDVFRTVLSIWFRPDLDPEASIRFIANSWNYFFKESKLLYLKFLSRTNGIYFRYIVFFYKMVFFAQKSNISH